jgi:hypothetical protein
MHRNRTNQLIHFFLQFKVLLSFTQVKQNTMYEAAWIYALNKICSNTLLIIHEWAKRQESAKMFSCDSDLKKRLNIASLLLYS